VERPRAGRVFEGKLDYRIDRVEYTHTTRPRTKVQMNVGDPEQAFSLASTPNDGVGLARIEFIVTNSIRVHPMTLLHPERLDAGISIGSNDLTQLTLGVDRDSPLVAFDFDERDPGVIEMMRLAVEGAHRNGRHVGICGQAPSDYPEIAAFLVRVGIDALSLNPDSVLATTVRLLELELGDGARRPRESEREPLARTIARA
jgi:pyruvate,water dikinase